MQSSDSLESEGATDYGDNANDFVTNARLQLNGNQTERENLGINNVNIAERFLHSTPIGRLKQRPMAAIVDQYSPKNYHIADPDYRTMENNRYVGNEEYERPKNWDASPSIQNYLPRSIEPKRNGNPVVDGQYRGFSGYTQPNNGFIPTLSRINDEIATLMSNMQRQGEVPIANRPAETYKPSDYGYNAWSRNGPFTMRQYPYENATISR